jgi:ERCC4-type nuclease
MLNLDTMGAIRSMSDGKIYDSKSALRKQYKQAGVVEVGDDKSVTNPMPFKRPKVDRKAVSNTVDKAFAQAGLGA